ncbi:hypothetical protein [Lentzea sp. E54]|uniref:hypothetical protein n=1 Tax=Lentzea xerophila TaxID=3435883 RepID=UPI003DA2F34A
MHLARFLPGGHLDVVQAWDEQWAVWARLPDSLDPAAPFARAVCEVRSGPLARVVAPLLPSGLTAP